MLHETLLVSPKNARPGEETPEIQATLFAPPHLLRTKKNTSDDAKSAFEFFYEHSFSATSVFPFVKKGSLASRFE